MNTFKCINLLLIFLHRLYIFFEVLGLLYKNVLNFEQSITKLHFTIKRDSKHSSPFWDFSEYQILFDIEKTFSTAALDAGKANEKSNNFRMFL